MEEAGFEVVAAHNAAEAMAAFDAEPVKIQGPRHGHKPGQIRLASRSASAPGEPNHTRDLIYMSGDRAIHRGAEGVPESVMITKPFTCLRSYGFVDAAESPASRPHLTPVPMLYHRPADPSAKPALFSEPIQEIRTNAASGCLVDS